jgi:hypothetical protein
MKKDVLLIDIDSSIPNLALKKIEIYHKDKGDNVIIDIPLMAYKADKVYVSCIFKKNKKQAQEYEMYDHALIGGSGYSLDIKLPNEIEKIKPRINYGFTTRGCIRKCGFCIVPKKEGYVHIVGDLLDLWDGESPHITVMDNNILALPEHFIKVCEQAKANKIKVDFNQGLDHRLLTPELAKVMKQTPHFEYRFAYDNPSMKDSVEKAVDILKMQGIKRGIWYVLVGYNTDILEDLMRLEHLRKLGQRCYVMRYKKKPEYIGLANWGNAFMMFSAMSFADYLKHPKAKSHLKGVDSDMKRKIFDFYKESTHE